MTSFLLEWKEKGNDAFKSGDYVLAKEAYTKALAHHTARDEQHAILLSNRAACHLKESRFDDAIDDCTKALQIIPTQSKALYRRATAYEALQRYQDSAKDLSLLLQIEPKNASAVVLMRKVKEAVQSELADSSEVKNILDGIQKQDSKIGSGLSALIGLCYDDRTHALDLYRKGGVAWLCNYFNQELERWLNQGERERTLANADTLVSALRVLSAASNHKDFVLSLMDIASEDPIYDAAAAFSGARLNVHSPSTAGNPAAAAAVRSGIRDRLTFVSVCSLLPVLKGTCALPALLMLVMNTLKAFPVVLPGAGPDAPPLYSISRYCAHALLAGLCFALDTDNPESFTAVTDTISSFLSDSPDYFETPAREIDLRMEGAEARQKRVKETELVRNRSRAHCTWAIERGIVQQLVCNVDSEVGAVRLNSSNCLGKLVNYLNDPERLKPILLPFLPGQAAQEEPSESKRVVEILDTPYEPLTVPACRLRAALEASLLLAQPELGTWALELPGGVPQLLFLVSTGDLRCQEVAAEVICLASAVEAGASLLASVVSSGTLTTLLHAPSPAIRAAAASTITKLSIKAKALTQDSAEVGQIMNTALAVLKAVNNPNASPVTEAAQGKGDSLVSFSALDEVSNTRALHKKSEAEKSDKSKKQQSQALSAAGSGGGGITMTALERAIESLAALVGKSYVKEEIVHGSYRVAPCVAELVKLDLDVRSTAAYGVAHILAALTVTNRELRAIALADKDITPEQYEQMQELQRIKTKDEEGRVVEEKKEETDADSQDLCGRRIQRVVACDAIKFLVKYLAAGSAQTKEAAARALRQIAVEVSVRGQMVQQGALKACCAAAGDENNKKPIRQEAAHAVAKTLITTNPNMLSEHQRLGCIKPLLLLCKESASTNLQQFEALLALTNVLSCGAAEQDKFAAEKGVGAVHYLIFSEHWMVRRAAVEALCNMATNEHLLQLLRAADKVKLWLGLCEEGIVDDSEELDESVTPEARKAWDEERRERYLTARASAGTLAMAAGADEAVCKTLCELDCAKTICALLETAKPELVHRALVWVNEMASAPEDAAVRVQCATHLVEGGAVGAIGVVLRLNDATLGGLAREAAQALSKAVNEQPPSSATQEGPVLTR